MFKLVLRTLWHYVLVSCISFIILFAVVISTIRLMLPTLSHQGYMQRLTSRLLNVPVRIGDVTTAWYGLQPGIYINRVQLFNAKTGQPELSVGQVNLQINLLSSLIHWQLRPSRVTIDGAHVTIEKDPVSGKFYISGLAQRKTNLQHATHLNAIITWLLTQSDITLTHIHLTYLNKLQFKSITLRIRNNYFTHHIYARLALAGKRRAQLQVIAKLYDTDNTLKNLNGNVYVAIQNVSDKLLSTLKTTIAKFKNVPLNSLDGTITGWIGISKGTLSNALLNYALKKIGFDHINLEDAQGKIEWDTRLGAQHIHIENHNGMMHIPQLFDHPLPLHQVTGNASYHKDRQGFDIKVPTITISDNNLWFQGKIHLQKKLKQPLLIDFISAFKLAQLNTLSTYLPANLMKPALLKWATQAFKGGQLNHGIIVYRGPISRFMTSDQQSQFEVSADLHHLALSYSPHWPIAYNGELNVTIHNRLLQVRGNQIASMHNWVDRLMMTLPLIKNPILTLTLQGKTDAHDGWNYIEHTPLSLAQKLKNMRLKGPVDFLLRVKLPLHKKPHDDATTQGHITVGDVTLALPQWNIAFKHIQGRLQFHNKSLYDAGNALRASLFGQPVKIAVNTLYSSKNHHAIEFNCNGILTTKAIREHFPLPFVQFFKGQSLFAASLILHSKKSIGDDLHITSNLVGVSSDTLPDPFSKTTANKRPLQLDITMREKKPLYLRVNYAQLASAALLYDKSARGLRFHSGNIELGGGHATYLSAPGLVIKGILPELKWSQWQKFLDQLLATQSSQKHKQVIAVRSLSLVVKKLYAYHSVLNDVHLALTALKSSWKVVILNKAMDGYIIIPQNHHNTWVFNFKRLYLPAMTAQSNTLLNPERLAPLHVMIKDFKLAKAISGSLKLVTLRQLHAMRIKNLELQSDHYTLTLQGLWKNEVLHQSTEISGLFKTNDGGSLLQKWYKL